MKLENLFVFLKTIVTCTFKVAGWCLDIFFSMPPSEVEENKPVFIGYFSEEGQEGYEEHNPNSRKNLHRMLLSDD